MQLGLDVALYEHADAAVVNAIARVTGGNFRLVELLFAQIERIVAINNRPIVTTESSRWRARDWSTSRSRRHQRWRNSAI